MLAGFGRHRYFKTCLHPETHKASHFLIFDFGNHEFKKIYYSLFLCSYRNHHLLFMTWDQIYPNYVSDVGL